LARRVLVAEDDPPIQSMLHEFLLEEGFEVDVASHGGEALQLARTKPPDVGVFDVMMPIVDARTLLAEWQQDSGLKTIPVILLSAAPGLSEIAAHFNVRATLAKPLDRDVLRAIIHQVLAHPETPPDVPVVPAE